MQKLFGTATAFRKLNSALGLTFDGRLARKMVRQTKDFWLGYKESFGCSVDGTDAPL